MKTATVNFCGRRKAQQTRVWCVLTVAVLAISMTVPAQAIVPVLGWGYSVGYGAQYVLGVNGTRSGDGWSGWFDPPANVISGQVTFYYDPSLITILPQYSGPAGVFSQDPTSAPPVNSSEFYGAFQVANLPSPRPGNVWNLVVGTNTVTLQFDLSANPVSLDPAAGPVNMYELSMKTAKPLYGFTVNHTDSGQFHEVGSLADQSQTYMNCSASDGSAYRCGETTSTTVGFGLTAIPTPEPSSLALLGSGLLGLSGFVRKRLLARG
jgi:hypothetical protein